MKKLITIIFAFIITLGCCSCSFDKNTDIPKENEEYLEKIVLLQSELSKLNEKHNEYVESSNVRLELLSKEIEALKKEGAEDKTEDKPSQDQKKEFLYDTDGEAAILTGYVGGDTILVIPIHIDGYPVIKIGEKALSSSKLTTVIISEGVKEIDWFAFYNSPFLVNVTIPKSVTKIGYSAFEGCSSSITIYCERGSYAHSYAQSFGIPYVIM